MSKEKISGNQIFWMISTMQIGMTILLTINPSIAAAKQDAWISILFSSMFSVGLAYVLTRISIMYPNESLITYAPKIMGKFLGHVIILVYVLYWFTVLSIILRQYGDFMIGTILQLTPVVIPIAGMLVVAAYVSYAGIEVLARCSEVLGPLILLGIMVPLLLNISDIQVHNLLPVMSDNSLLVLLQGALPTASFLGDNILLMMILPFVADPRKGVKGALLGSVIAGLFTLFSAMECIAIFGDSTAGRQTYPFLNLVRFISFGFLQNLDAIVIAIWIMGIFIKVSLYLFAASYGTAQWFGVKRWRILIFIVAPVAIVLSMLPRNFVDSSILFPKLVAVPIILPFNFILLPLLLWIVGTIRNRKRNSGKKKAAVN
ncbi:endospore germination permease [Paenibacillus barcinonensis]|uniref:Endospore germination permease n=1 Tax=Paenibacillus barcinonensis TaxID=198119 RepID=A0A2V4WA52_PAEBA|nr:endospore germination permease [Paenibacillus barcinonensis]PYE52441.1 spore germination protein KB [Paenibacillus barcinonensis]QKS59450.1 endospore germination permease [Paenibacillus barcinonensis]